MTIYTVDKRDPEERPAWPQRHVAEQSSLLTATTPESTENNSASRYSEVQWSLMVQEAVEERIRRKLFARFEAWFDANEARKLRIRELLDEGFSEEEANELAGPIAPEPDEESPEPDPAGLQIRDREKRQARVWARQFVRKCLGCLQCRVKGLKCSLQDMGCHRQPRCQQCMRNGEETCIQCAETVEAMMRIQVCAPGETRRGYYPQRGEAHIDTENAVCVQLPGESSRIVLFVRKPGVSAEALTKRVFKLASGTVTPYSGLMGVPLTTSECRGMALPMWCDDDRHERLRSTTLDEIDMRCRGAQTWQTQLKRRSSYSEMRRQLKMLILGKLEKGELNPREPQYLPQRPQYVEEVSDTVPQMEADYDTETSEVEPWDEYEKMSWEDVPAGDYFASLAENLKGREEDVIECWERDITASPTGSESDFEGDDSFDSEF